MQNGWFFAAINPQFVLIGRFQCLRGHIVSGPGSSTKPKTKQIKLLISGQNIRPGRTMEGLGCIKEEGGTSFVSNYSIRPPIRFEIPQSWTNLLLFYFYK